MRAKDLESSRTQCPNESMVLLYDLGPSCHIEPPITYGTGSIGRMRMQGEALGNIAQFDP